MGVEDARRKQCCATLMVKKRGWCCGTLICSDHEATTSIFDMPTLGDECSMIEKINTHPELSIQYAIK